jgi:hypothetical protein
MGTRGQRRAAARAGRVCPVCGGQVEARRSTARYCSDKCRVAAHRRKGVPRKRQGLTPAQLRILAVLSRLKHPIDRYCIGVKLAQDGEPRNRGHMAELMGHNDPDLWSYERTGIFPLRGLGYIKVHEVDDNGRIVMCYTITEAGRKALDEQGQDTAPVPPSPASAPADQGA